MHPHKRHLVAPTVIRSLVATLSVGLLAGCASTDTAEDGNSNAAVPASADEFLLGFSSDLSTPATSGLGLPLLAGLETYVSAVNEDGGIHGKKLRIEALDDRFDQAVGKSNYQELVDAGALLVTGNVPSQVWTAVGPMASKEEVPQIGIAGIGDFFDPVDPWVFSFHLLGASAARIEVEAVNGVIADELGLEPKTYGLMRYASPATDQWSEAAQESLTGEAGLDLAREEVVAIDATDISGQSANIAKSNPDVVISILQDEQAIQMVESLRDRGYDGPIVNWLGNSDTMLERIKDQKFYVVRKAKSPGHQTDEDVAEMMKAADEAGTVDRATSPMFTIGYVQGQAITQALEACGSECDPSGMRDALENVDLDAGLMGPVNASAAQHLLVRYGAVFRWDDGESGVTQTSDWIADPAHTN